MVHLLETNMLHQLETKYVASICICLHLLHLFESVASVTSVGH